MGRDFIQNYKCKRPMRIANESKIVLLVCLKGAICQIDSKSLNWVLQSKFKTLESVVSSAVLLMWLKYALKCYLVKANSTEKKNQDCNNIGTCFVTKQMIYRSENISSTVNTKLQWLGGGMFDSISFVVTMTY